MVVLKEDIPETGSTLKGIGASTGTNYRAYFDLREKYSSNEIIASIISGNYTDEEKQHLITSLAVTWDDIALSAYKMLLDGYPQYKVGDTSLSYLIMIELARFSTQESKIFVGKYTDNSQVSGAKGALENIASNIKRGWDPSANCGRANAHE